MGFRGSPGGMKVGEVFPAQESLYEGSLVKRASRAYRLMGLRGFMGLIGFRVWWASYEGSLILPTFIPPFEASK